jgi:GTPase Era involved in 16S rRNA processing
MSKYYIPIIGTISAGKTTFLKAFLGTEVLETGATTTTKFICLIKHSSKTSFYHVIPKKQNDGISFIKQGEEIKDINQIKKKIEEVNKSLSEKNGTKDDIFYMYETQIKNIKNQQLLDKCYFMDIPGLNEDKKNYIEDIFSLISLKDILFEIMIFDSTNIGSDSILKIFRKIEKKGCLKKENNLYILNKIDQITPGGEENIIDSFKQYFYYNFEDEKKNKSII